MKQEIMEWQAVESAGPYANRSCLTRTSNHTSTLSFNFHGVDALPDTQPTVSKHWRQKKKKNNNKQRLIKIKTDQFLFSLASYVPYGQKQTGLL